MEVAKHTAFDRSSQHRRVMIAKVHIAVKELGLSEDDYRGILLDKTGEMSSGECTEAQLAELLDHFKAKGFKPKRKSSAADHPVARKARALWISLHHLGVVRNPSEQALEAFAKRQLKVERLQWTDQSMGYRLIEALKEMGAREGWKQGGAHKLPVFVLQRNLCDAILAKLKKAGLAADDWTLAVAAYRLTGTELPETQDAFTAEHYLRLAKALGSKLREKGHG